MIWWQVWLQHPERSRTRQALFHTHLWLGALLSLYVFFMSISGSILVFQKELSERFSLEWLVKLHTNLGFGPMGRLVNGIGAMGVTGLCLTGAVIWWPGIRHWRRSLTVNWSANFPRISWDLHSALGFWCFLFVLEWGVSAVYFSFPRLFDSVYVVDPKDRFADPALYWLSQLHFGRFGWLAEAVWSMMGLVLALLAFTGVFICCRRMIYHKPSNPKAESD
jgi:uncharacterized iron-regulated membrane protein